MPISVQNTVLPTSTKGLFHINEESVEKGNTPFLYIWCQTFLVLEISGFCPYNLCLWLKWWSINGAFNSSKFPHRGLSFLVENKDASW